MSIITLPDTDKYAELSTLARGEVKLKFGESFEKGERYLENFLDGSTEWTLDRSSRFNELVQAQHDFQKALKRESITNLET